MAKKKYASLTAGMIKTVQAFRTVVPSIDDDGNIVAKEMWGFRDVIGVPSRKSA